MNREMLITRTEVRVNTFCVDEERRAMKVMWMIFNSIYLSGSTWDTGGESINILSSTF